MHLIEGTIRSYDWGSHTALAQLTGRPLPTDHPEAEMWFGAHPAAPSLVVSEESTLDQFLETDPTQLGEAHKSLPFLLKFLAADKALSLQAHPSKAEAEEGFAAENAAGVPLNAFDRSYKDDNHKPELVVALTPFDALSGFRAVASTVELLRALELPELDSFIAMLGSGDDAADIRGLFTTWVTLPQDFMSELLQAVVARCEQLIDATPDSLSPWIIPSLETVLTLSRQFPGDSGVLCSLLLNHVRLQPGEALYLDAGQLHAYLNGTAVEIMANSDNVLRSGLTSKHVDVPELMKVMTFSPLENPVLEADAEGFYDTPAPDFRLRRIPAGRRGTVEGPAIILSVGQAGVVLRSDEPRREIALASGRAVWVGAKSSPVEVAVEAEDSLAFIATVGTAKN